MPGALTRTFGVLVVAALTVLGLVALADATKFEGEQAADGETRVELAVRTTNYHHSLDDAASALWYACVGSVSWDELDPVEPIGDGTYVGAVRPSLGEDSTRRLRGCLEDLTVDRVLGEVITIRRLPAT